MEINHLSAYIWGVINVDELINVSSKYIVTYILYLCIYMDLLREN